MMYNMDHMTNSMMLGMGFIGFLFVVMLVLGIVALAKYTFSENSE